MYIELLYYLQTFELACLTVLVGVLVAALILRVCGVNPGGILGTSFLLLAASDSVIWAMILLAIAPLISWVYGKFFSRIYRGREPSFLLAGMSVLLATLAGLILQHYEILTTGSFSFPLGIILPAIIASAVRKQGLGQTYRYLLMAVILTLEVLIIIYGIGWWLGYDFTALAQLAESRESVELSYSSLFAFASVVTGYLVYRHYEVQAAGFIIVPLLAAMAIISPLNFLLLVATGAVAYALTSLLRRHSLIIGTSRYALATAISITLVWTVTYVLLHVTDDFSPFMGTGLFAALSVSVLVNEHTLYGIRRTFPVFAASIAIMAVIQVGGSAFLGIVKDQPKSLKFYVVRQSADS